MTYTFTVTVRDETGQWIVDNLTKMMKRRKMKSLTSGREAKMIGFLFDNLVEAHVIKRK